MTWQGRTTSTTGSSFFAGFATTTATTSFAVTVAVAMPVPWSTPMVVRGRQKFTKKRLQVKTFHFLSFPVFVVFRVRLFRVAAAVVSILTFRDGGVVVINNGVPPSENSLISCETARNLIMWKGSESEGGGGVWNSVRTLKWIFFFHRFL